MRLHGKASQINSFSIETASLTILFISSFDNLFSNLLYNKIANSVCKASSRLINSFENVNPGNNPLFFIQ